jgi:hypothetical protein
MASIPPNTYINPNYRGWHNAPAFRSFVAAQLVGGGACVFGAKHNGEIFGTSEFHGVWSAWGFGGQGPRAVKLAAAGHRDSLQLWAIDDDMRLWSLNQGQVDIVDWEGPNWNVAPPLHRIAAGPLSGGLVAGLWAITSTDYSLITCFRYSGRWTPWVAFPGTPEKSKFRDIAAAQLKDGRAALWAIDTKLQLWYRHEMTPGKWDWSNWVGPNWNSARALGRVIACQQGASRGARVWGTTPDLNEVISNYQEKQDGSWTGWVPGTSEGGGHSLNLAAAPQTNGTIRLWSSRWEDLSLSSIEEVSPGGDWKNWE